MATAPDRITEIVRAWQDANLVQKAACGTIATVGKDMECNRREVCHNYAILVPLVQHLGTLACHH